MRLNFSLRWRSARRLEEPCSAGKNPVPITRRKLCGERESASHRFGDCALTAFVGRFFCAAVAALTLRAMDPYGNGKLVLLEVTYTRDYHTNSIYVVALILGVLGVGYLYSNEKAEAYLF